MLSSEEEQIIKELEENGNLSEVSKVTKYKGYHKDTQEEVVITIYDHGSGAGLNRYFVKAVLDGGEKGKKYASGNGGKTLEMALGILHWSNFDSSEPYQKDINLK